MKKSRRWCRVTRHTNIEDKFKAQDKNKRIYFPEVRFTIDDLAYLKESARRKNISCSCQLEHILNTVFYKFMIDDISYEQTKEGKTRKRIDIPKEFVIKKRRFTIHPSLISLIKSYAQKQEIELTYLLHKIFELYKQKYPIYKLSNQITYNSPPFYKLEI